jgi:hypothetical protein
MLHHGKKLEVELQADKKSVEKLEANNAKLQHCLKKLNHTIDNLWPEPKLEKTAIPRRKSSIHTPSSSSSGILDQLHFIAPTKRLSILLSSQGEGGELPSSPSTSTNNKKKKQHNSVASVVHDDDDDDDDEKYDIMDGGENDDNGEDGVFEGSLSDNGDVEMRDNPLMYSNKGV